MRFLIAWDGQERHSTYIQSPVRMYETAPRFSNRDLVLYLNQILRLIFRHVASHGNMGHPSDNDQLNFYALVALSDL